MNAKYEQRELISPETGHIVGHSNQFLVVALITKNCQSVQVRVNLQHQRFQRAPKAVKVVIQFLEIGTLEQELLPELMAQFVRRI